MPPPFALLVALLAPVQDPAPPPAALPPAEDGSPSLIDPRDGWLDVSAFLEHAAGFLPLVIPVTEPALGYGAVVGAMFLDPREDAGTEGWARPNITFVGGMLTEDGSEGLFAANSTLWGDGDVQTLVAGGAMRLELALYGIGDELAPGAAPIDYRLEPQVGMAEVRRRFGASRFWGGLRYTYAQVGVDFEDPAGGVGGVDREVEDVTMAGPAATVRYDSLDNMMTPTSGLLSDTSVSVFDDLFGGSRDFQLFQSALIHHWPLGEGLFLGVRGQFHASFGDVPFYARPFIDLRGVPALRYQGEQVFSGEAEMRWQFHPRVSAVGFGGLGYAWNDDDDLGSDQDAWSVGLGGRYLIASKFGLHMGLDVARGPEDTAIYVQVGNAWMRP